MPSDTPPPPPHAGDHDVALCVVEAVYAPPSPPPGAPPLPPALSTADLRRLGLVTPQGRAAREAGQAGAGGEEPQLQQGEHMTLLDAVATVNGVTVGAVNGVSVGAVNGGVNGVPVGVQAGMNGAAANGAASRGVNGAVNGGVRAGVKGGVIWGVKGGLKGGVNGGVAVESLDELAHLLQYGGPAAFGDPEMM